MSRSISEAVALFRSHLQQRRFDGTTLRILESILVARDVESLLVSRAALRGLLLSEASSVMGGASGMTVETKLRIVQFFVGAFALIGDGEGFEKALQCIQGNKIENREDVKPSMNKHITLKNIEKLRDMATSLTSERSVQTQTSEYLKSKGRQQGQISSSLSDPKVDIASSTFRCGINKRNLQMLQRSRGL